MKLFSPYLFQRIVLFLFIITVHINIVTLSKFNFLSWSIPLAWTDMPVMFTKQLNVILLVSLPSLGKYV